MEKDSMGKKTHLHRPITKIIVSLISALIIAAGIGYSGYQIGNGFAGRGNNVITVTGYASAPATSDSANWSLQANEVSNSSAASAVTKVNNDLDQLVKYLVAGGISKDAISYGSLSTSINYKIVNGNPTSDVSSYSANQSISLQSKDVNLINKLSNGIGAVLTNGANINNNYPQYYVSTLSSLKPTLLAQAMLDARSRAKSIVSAVGGQVGAVVSVSSGPFQVTTPDSTDTSGGGIYDTSSIPKTVSTTVTVSFKVK
jgi:uncharacterized protein